MNLSILYVIIVWSLVIEIWLLHNLVVAVFHFNDLALEFVDLVIAMVFA